MPKKDLNILDVLQGGELNNAKIKGLVKQDRV